MDNVTVLKEALIETLVENLKTHQGQYDAAVEKYTREAVQVLHQRLKDARDLGKVNLDFDLPKPVTYADHYTRTIKMLQWSINDEVVLTRNEFDQYVLNNWAWMPSFTTASLSYLGS